MIFLREEDHGDTIAMMEGLCQVKIYDGRLLLLLLSVDAALLSLLLLYEVWSLCDASKTQMLDKCCVMIKQMVRRKRHCFPYKCVFTITKLMYSGFRREEKTNDLRVVPVLLDFGHNHVRD